MDDSQQKRGTLAEAGADGGRSPSMIMSRILPRVTCPREGRQGTKPDSRGCPTMTGSVGTQLTLINSSLVSRWT